MADANKRLKLTVQGVDQGASQLMVSMQTGVNAVGQSVDQLSRKLGQQASESARQFGTAMNEQMTKAKVSLDNLAGSLATVGASLAGLGAAIAGPGAFAIKTAADFEKAGKRVEAVSLASQADMKAMSDEAKHLGEVTEFTATQAMNAFEVFKLAGVDTRDAIAGMKPALDLASAGSLELAESVDILVNIMKPFNLTGKDAADIANTLGVVATSVNTNVRALGEGFSYASGLAHAVGMSVNEAASAMGIMAESGVRGERAGTALRGILNSLISPTEEAKQAMQDYNIVIQKSPEGHINLVDVLRQFSQVQDKASLASQVFTRAQLQGALALITNVDGLVALTDKTNKATGTTEKMAGIMRSGVIDAITKVKSSIEGLALAMAQGLLPKIEKALNVIMEWINAMTLWAKAHPVLANAIMIVTVGLGALAAALGALMLVISGFLYVIPKIGIAWRQSLGVASGATTTLRTGLTGLSGILNALLSAIIPLGNGFNQFGNSLRKTATDAAFANKQLAQMDIQIANARNRARGWVSSGIAGAKKYGGAIAGIGLGLASASGAFDDMGDKWDKRYTEMAAGAVTLGALLGGIGLQVSIIGAGIVGWGNVMRHVPDVLTDIIGLSKEWAAAVEGIINLITNPLRNGFNMILNLLGVAKTATEELPKGTSKTAKAMADEYIKQAGNASGAIKALFAEHGAANKKLGDTTVHQVRDAIWASVSGLSEAQKKAKEEAVKAAKEAQKEIEALAKIAALQIQKQFQDMQKAIQEMTEGIKVKLDKAKEVFRDFERTLTEKTGIEEYAKAYETMTEALAGSLKDINKGMNEQLTAAIALFDRAKEKGAGLQEAAAGLGNLAKEAKRNFEEISKAIVDALNKAKDEYAKTLKAMTDLEREHKAEVDAIQNGTVDARRTVLRKLLTEGEKYYETLIYLSKQLEKARELEAQGSDEAFKKAQEIRKRVQTEAAGLGEITETTPTGQKQTIIPKNVAAAQALYLINQADADLQKAEKAHYEEKEKKLKEQQDLYQKQIDQLEELRKKAEELRKTFSEAIKVQVDMSQVEAELAKERTIKVKAKLAGAETPTAPGAPPSAESELTSEEKAAQASAVKEAETQVNPFFRAIKEVNQKADDLKKKVDQTTQAAPAVKAGQFEGIAQQGIEAVGGAFGGLFSSWSNMLAGTSSQIEVSSAGQPVPVRQAADSKDGESAGILMQAALMIMGAAEKYERALVKVRVDDKRTNTSVWEPA